MIYIFLFLFLSGYFFCFSKLRSKNIFVEYSIYIPAIFFLFILSANQYGVGTDYFTYKDMYYNDTLLNTFKNSNEYYFYYVVTTLRYFSFSSQSLFFLYSFTIIFPVFYGFAYVSHKSKLKIFWLFVAFYLVSGFYHNQLNLIRQMQAAAFVFLFAIMLFEKRNVLALIFIFFAIISHPSAVIAVAILLVKFIRYKKTRVIYIFITSIFIYLFLIPFLLKETILIFLPQYYHYIESGFVSGINVLSLASKLYYLPLNILFLYLVYKSKDESDSLLNKLVLVWAMFSMSYLSGIYFAVADRIYLYFVLFNVIIIGLLLSKIKKNFGCILIFIYIFIPYFLKVTLFAKAEYLYHGWLLR